MTDDAPTMQVTMLGGSGSGKTTYLIGMYAHLSAGLANFFLHADDRGVDLDLSAAWSGMIEDGLLPQPTTEENGYRTFDFTFRYGLDPLLRLNWVDYRGGALRDRAADKQDVSQLLARLSESDSLYVTLDGGLLADVLAERPMAERQLRDTIGRYSRTIGEIRDERNKRNLVMPSVVVLVTKADLLRPLLPGTPEQRRERLRSWAVDLLGQVFSQGWDSAVCLASIGAIGRPSTSHVNPEDVNPVGVHKPMVFSLYSYYRRAAVVFSSEAQEAENALTQGRLQQQQLQRTVVTRLLSRKERAQLVDQLGDLHAYHGAMRQLAELCRYRSEGLADELIETPMHLDGRWTGTA
ncbi:MAG: TRAFAC clade GTPase domain-containing protein [Kineosporiaceae bacterium]